MIKLTLTLIAAATLVACATPQRQGPPAPVVSAAQPKPVQVAAPPSAESAPRPVELYPYKPPSEVARIPQLPMPEQLADAGDSMAGPEQTVASAPGAATGGEVAPPAMPSPGGATPPSAQSAAPATPANPGAPEAVAAAQGTTPASPAAALSVQAEQQRQSGDYAGAAATLERALGYQPRNAALWNRLARVRMEQGLNSQAANLAAKSNSLAGGADQAALRQDNWSIIAAARRQAGDTAGAQDAERKARGV